MPNPQHHVIYHSRNLKSRIDSTGISESGNTIYHSRNLKSRIDLIAVIPPQLKSTIVEI